MSESSLHLKVSAAFVLGMTEFCS